MKRITERQIPTLIILSYNEIVPQLVEIQTIGVVKLNINAEASS